MSLKYKDGSTTYTPWQSSSKCCLRTSDPYGCTIASKSSSSTNYVPMIYYQTNGSTSTTTYNFPFIQTNTIVDGSTISTYALHFISYETGHRILHCAKNNYRFKEIKYNSIGTLPNSYTISDTVLSNLGCIRITTVKYNGGKETSKTYIVGPNSTKTYNDGSTIYTWTGSSTVIGYVNGTTAYYKGTYTSKTLDYSGLCYLGTSVNSTYNKIQNCNLSSTSSNTYPLTISTNPTGFTGAAHNHSFTISNVSVSSAANDKNGSYNIFNNRHNNSNSSTHSHGWEGTRNYKWSSSWEWWDGYGYEYKLLSPIANAKVVPANSVVFTLEGQAMDSSYATEIRFVGSNSILAINNSNGNGESHGGFHKHSITGVLTKTYLNDVGNGKRSTLYIAHLHSVELYSGSTSTTGHTPTKRLRMWKLTTNKNIYDLPTYVYFLIYDKSKLPDTFEIYNVNWGTYNGMPICINTNASNPTGTITHSSVTNTNETDKMEVSDPVSNWYVSNTNYTKQTFHTHQVTYTVSSANHNNISNLPKCSLALCHRKQ